MIEQRQKMGNFCTKMVDFYRPGHICAYTRICVYSGNDAMVYAVHTYVYLQMQCEIGKSNQL